jgi:hypothetical protein
MDALKTGSGRMDAERAFTRTTRARRRAALARRLRREPAELGTLTVYDPGTLPPTTAAEAGQGIREIPLEKIGGTVEPSRARLFDRCFRPATPARGRWQRVWLAEERGAPLPPISVVRVGDAYAVRDGHHRVSVARARGAVSIDASVDGVLAA